MKKINWKIRFKNPVFWFQVALAVITPIVAYMGITVEDLTTWNALGEALVGALMNPYLLVVVIVSVWNAVNDPTTEGITDSDNALTYTELNK